MLLKQFRISQFTVSLLPCYRRLLRHANGLCLVFEDCYQFDGELVGFQMYQAAVSND